MGVDGLATAETLRKKDKNIEIIVVYNQEPYYYYFSSWLIDLLAGRKSKKQLFPHTPEWHEKQRISVMLSSQVVRINPSEKTIELEDGKTDTYDKLVLARGSTPFIPPFRNKEGKGVFSLRSLDDTLKLIELSKKVKKALVIGGGLLGLEMAYALKQRGLDVQVFEYFERLLPRQLDKECASILQSKIEEKGISVITGARVAEILRKGKKVRGLAFENGQIFDGDVILVTAGNRSNIKLPKDAGLQINRGVIVNEFMETSAEDVYAIGDVAEFNGRVYGIIPAALDQAKIAVENILGNQIKYTGTIPSNTLHVMGIEVTSIGVAQPEPEKKGEYEEIRVLDEKKGTYKKFVIKDGKLVGLIMVGTEKYVHAYARLIRKGTDIAHLKDKLADESISPREKGKKKG